MKKLINKIFEWLGYVPKVEVAKLEYSIYRYETLIDQMRENRGYLLSCILVGKSKAYYHWNKISENKWRFVVYVGCEMQKQNAVKSYVSEDFEYAKLCAEELCEKLNERI